MKEKNNQDYYRLDKVLSTHASHIVLFGERSNGKSFAVKEKCLQDAYNNVGEFALVRRWKEEVKARKVEKYFDDLVLDKKGVEHIKRITNGEYSDISCYNGEIFFANTDGFKKERGKKIGDIFYLTGETHFKSIAYPHIVNIIFEEMITKSGYLPREVEIFESLISTILRRDIGRVYLIGNTLTRVCPYFAEWGLTHVTRQKIGTIETYKHLTNQIDDNGNPVVINIAVEYCPNSGKNSKMFFGKSSSMITMGEWETESYLHLEKRLSEYKCYYTMYAEWSTFRFCIKLLRENNIMFVYVYPYTKVIPDNVRIVSDKLSLQKLHSHTFLQYRTGYDRMVVDLITQGKVCFSDNLCGTDFFSAFKL